MKCYVISIALIAQLVEQQVPNLKVKGSSLEELMKISFHESQVDIICDRFNDSSKKIIQPMQKKVSLNYTYEQKKYL